MIKAAGLADKSVNLRMAAFVIENGSGSRDAYECFEALRKEGLSEEIGTALIRWEVKQGRKDAAMAILDTMCNSSGIIVKPRTFEPLIAVGSNDDRRTILAKMRACDVAPSEKWLRAFLDLRPPEEGLVGELESLGVLHDAALVSSVERYLSASGLTLEWTELDAQNGVLHGERLATPVDVAVLERKLEHLHNLSRAIGVGGYLPRATNEILWDVVLDGANIGHSCQNWYGGQFSYSQIDAVVEYYQMQGKRVLLVLGDKWLAPDAPVRGFLNKRTKHQGVPAESKAVLERVEPGDGRSKRNRKRKLLSEEKQAEIRYYAKKWAPMLHTVGKGGQSDDWHWLAAALQMSIRGHPVKVVSNDIIRDHLQWEAAHVKDEVLGEWYELHQTKFHFAYLEDRLDQKPFNFYVYEPRPYVQRAQFAGGKWWIPTRGARSHKRKVVVRASGGQQQSRAPTWGLAALPKAWEPYALYTATWTPLKQECVAKGFTGDPLPQLPSDATWLVASPPATRNYFARFRAQLGRSSRWLTKTFSHLQP